MRPLKILILLFAGILAGSGATAQANASINILTQNSGQVNLGGTVYIQVDIGNSGPASDIGVNKVRAQISVPSAIVNPASQQDGLPQGWIVLTNTPGGITVCNGSDIIPVNTVRTVLIKVLGITLGGPSTVTGVLSFGPGTGVCTGPGSLPGDITADNTSTSSIQVIQPGPCNLGVTASAGIIVCNGGTTTLTATPTGANGPVEYSLTGGAPYQASNTFIVNAGTYIVTGREANNPNCIATAAAVTATQPAIVTAPLVGIITQPTCTTATGSADLGGLPSGNWTITRNPGGITVTGTGTSTTINGLPPGTYTFTVTNAAGCISTASANVTINTQSIPAAPTVNIVQPTCTTATGTINITSPVTGLTFSFDGGTYAVYPASGYIATSGTHTLTAKNTDGCISAVTNITVGAQPASPTAPAIGTITQPDCAVSAGFVVLNNLPSGNWIINPGNITGNTATTTINGLAPGIYTFTVTNEAGCTSTASANVVINNVPGGPPAPSVNIVQPTCTITTGTITITSTTTGLLFSLDGGAYTGYPAGGYIVAQGSHTLTAQNAASCISAITNITVDAQPATPAAPTVNVMHPICTVATGIITITSATAGLMFSLNGASYGSYPASGYIAATGSHTLTAQNVNGCISAVTNITLNAQPASPTASASAGTIACNGGTTTLTVSATGGTGALEYSLNGGAFQPDNIFTAGAGTYTITVRDANLCSSASAAIIITQPTAISVLTSANAITCNNGTATLTVAATGGTAPLQYSLNGGTFQSGNAFSVGAGTYTVTVRDGNLCTKTTAPVTITQRVNLTASATAKRITQCGGTTMVTVTASGGIVPYTSGIGTFTRGPGTWSFAVADAGGCTDTTEITIEAPGCMDLHVFPNPAKNSITINHSVAEQGSFMQVFEVNGARVIYQPVPQNAFQTTVDVGKLAAGSYILVYLNGSEKKTILFVKVSSN